MKNSKDLLERKEFVQNIVDIVDGYNSETDSLTISMNGSWGVGKTWVLEQLNKELFDKDEYIIFNYNVWENDFYQEPLVAIISILADQLNDFHKSKNQKEGIKKAVVLKARNTIFGVLGKISKYLTGVNILQIADDVNKEIKENVDNEKLSKNYDDYLILKNTINEVKKILRDLTENKKLVFLIDELDRCLPEYAIKVLERLHHIYNEMGKCVVVLSIDKVQLDNTICTIFGDKVNIKGYLKKFIDIELKLNIGKLNKSSCILNDLYLLFNIPEEKKEKVEKFTDQFLFDLDMRSRIKLLNKVFLIHNTFINVSLSEFNNSLLYTEIILSFLKSNGMLIQEILELDSKSNVKKGVSYLIRLWSHIHTSNGNISFNEDAEEYEIPFYFLSKFENKNYDICISHRHIDIDKELNEVYTYVEKFNKVLQIIE